MLSEIIAMFLDVTGTDVSWADRITATSRLEADLHLDSLEFAALAAKVRAEYGGAVDLFAFVADLDIDQLIALTIEDVAGYVSRARR